LAMKNISGNYFKFIIYMIIVVLINVAGVTLFYRLDLTRNQIYSISDASQKVVSTLSEPLTIKVFFTKNLPAPHNNTERYLHDLLEEYALHSNRHFNYTFYDMSPEEESLSGDAKENQELAKNYGIYPVQIRIIENDEIKFKKAYMGLVLIHGDIIEKISTISSTGGLEYKLTTAIQKLNNKISALLSLKDKINMRLYLSSSLEKVAPLMGLKDMPRIPERLETIIEKLNTKHYGKLAYVSLDPTKKSGLDAELKKYDVMSLKWPSLKDDIQAGEGAIGLVMAYGKKHVTIPLMQVLHIPILGTQYNLVEMEEMEEMISENLETLIDINEDLGYLTGRGTLALNGSSPMGPMGGQNQGLTSFRKLASQNYSIKEMDLKKDDAPESLKCLVIARPTEKMSDYELFQIDQMLMRGTNLALFLDAFNEVMPQQQNMYGGGGPTYVPIQTGLEKLLTHYGIKIKPAYVLDKSCYKQRVGAQFGGGERDIYFAPIIKNQFINNDLDFMQNIKGLIAMKISPLSPDKDVMAKNNLTGYQLFASSDQSWEMKGRINLNPMFMKPPASDEDMASYPLAYMIEGEFPSYFAGKSIPEKEAEETDKEAGDGEETPKEKAMEKDKSAIDLSKITGESMFLAKGKPGKIFIMATSELLKDNMLDEEGTSTNATFVMNMIDVLNNRNDIAVMRSKEQRFNPLDETDAGTKTVVKTFNIAGLPVFVVFFGLMVLLKRHGRKKYIRQMFQK